MFGQHAWFVTDDMQWCQNIYSCDWNLLVQIQSYPAFGIFPRPKWHYFGLLGMKCSFKLRYDSCMTSWRCFAGTKNVETTRKEWKHCGGWEMTSRFLFFNNLHRDCQKHCYQIWRNKKQIVDRSTIYISIDPIHELLVYWVHFRPAEQSYLLVIYIIWWFALATLNC